MARRRGRAPRRQRLIAAVLHGHWQTTTFLCGPRYNHLVALAEPGRAIDGVSFPVRVEQFLVPTLAPGDVVIADNLSGHKLAIVHQAIAACSARLRFLPTHSSDLNPIELAFSKLRRLLRTTAAHTVGALWQAFGQLLNQFNPTECANHL